MERFLVRSKRDAKEQLDSMGSNRKPCMVVQGKWWLPTPDMHSSQVYPTRFSQPIAALASALMRERA